MCSIRIAVTGTHLELAIHIRVMFSSSSSHSWHPKAMEGPNGGGDRSRPDVNSSHWHCVSGCSRAEAPWVSSRIVRQEMGW